MFKLQYLLLTALGTILVAGSYLLYGDHADADDHADDHADDSDSEDTDDGTLSSTGDNFTYFDGIQLSSWKIYENKETKNLVFSKNDEIIRELIYPK
jgi:hypothetical protein